MKKNDVLLAFDYELTKLRNRLKELREDRKVFKKKDICFIFLTLEVYNVMDKISYLKREREDYIKFYEKEKSIQQI